jgi:hypothetical protein
VGEDVAQDSALDVQAGLTQERALDYLRDSNPPFGSVVSRTVTAESLPVFAKRQRHGRRLAP